MQYRFEDYALDTRRCELRRTGMRIPLRPKVFDVLCYLIAHRDRVISRQELLEHLWPEQFVGEATLNSCIMEARQAVGDTGQAQRRIQTLHGRGYRFVAAVEEASESPPEEPTHARLALPHAAAPEDLGQAVPPAPVLGRAAHAGTEGLTTCPDVLEGERKQVTVLCCALADARRLAARLGPEAMYRLMRTFLALAQCVVQRYAGTLMQRLSDGFVAFFGAPVAQEDHARQAVLAALEVQQRAREEPTLRTLVGGTSLATSMGLHTGMVIVGPLEEEAQTLYAALDDTTEVAGCLQRLAGPDTILMSAATHRFVQEEVQVEAYEALDRAALPPALPVYRVRAVLVRRAGVPRRGGRPLSPFVGRRRELTALLALLAQVEAGQGQVVGIVGEPGIGKSRLLFEFARALRDTQVAYVEGHCFAYDQATPYGPVRGLLRQLCGMTDTDSPEVMLTKLRHGLYEAGLTPDADAPHLLPLLGLPEDPTALAEISPEVRKARTLALLRHLSLPSPQGRPRVIAVENVHWIDPTSEEYLTRLADSLAGAKVLLVITYRPGYRPPWIDKSYATQLALPRLQPQDSRAVVQAVLPSTPASAPWEQAMLDTAAGNPFFLEELAWAVRAGGVEPPTALLPDTVHAVLAARMDRLPPVAKRLLQTAAVIGHDIPLPLLRAIAELPEDVLQYGLARLQAGEFLYETRLVPEPEYTFKHALTHEVAYGSLLRERRRVLHARIVEVLGELAGDRLAEQVERLAYHALRGEVWDKAVTYCQQAGVRANGRAAFREAVAAFEQALQALVHLPEHRDTRVLAIELRLALVPPLVALGEQRRRLALLDEAETLARALNDQPRLVRVLAEMGAALRVTEALDGAVATGQQALDLAVELGESVLQVHASYNLGQAYYAIGDFSRAAELLRQNVEAADRASGTPGAMSRFRIQSRAWLAEALSALGAFAEGRRHGEEALRLATLEGHGNTPIVAYNSLGRLYLAQGDLEQAIRVCDHGLALCRVSGNRNQLRTIAACLGYASALQGRLAEGHALLEEAISESIRTGARRRPFWVAWLSEVCRLTGRGEEAWQHACQALDLARQQQDRGDEAVALHQLGIVHAHAVPPNAAQAEAHYQQALALAEELSMRPLQAHCHHGLGTLYGQMGQVAQARTELAAAIDLYRAMEMTFWLPQAEAALAQVETR